MVEPAGPWSSDRLEAFLAETTVPLRLACRTSNGRPWLVALWYTYRDGAFHCATGRGADVVGFLEAEPAVAMDVSVNDPPYMGVRGNGRASIRPDPEKSLLRDLLERYLGGTDSALADRLLAADREEVRIEIEPDRLVTWDYSDRMPDR